MNVSDVLQERKRLVPTTSNVLGRFLNQWSLARYDIDNCYTHDNADPDRRMPIYAIYTPLTLSLTYSLSSSLMVINDCLIDLFLDRPVRLDSICGCVTLNSYTTCNKKS